MRIVKTYLFSLLKRKMFSKNYTKVNWDEFSLYLSQKVKKLWA